MVEAVIAKTARFFANPACVSSTHGHTSHECAFDLTWMSFEPTVVVHSGSKGSRGMMDSAGWTSALGPSDRARGETRC